MQKVLVGLVSLLVLLSPLSAEPKYEFWPGTEYDPAIPTHNSVLGYSAGDRITSPDGILQYMKALEKASAGRMKIYEYARSWENRPLVYVVIGSPENMKRLDAIQDGMKKLLDPRVTNESQAKEIMKSLPAIVWLAYGIHGNEVSSPEAAMLTAHHLLAAKNSKMVDKVLKNTLVVLDPLQNPDGRNRFVQDFTQAEGLVPNANPEAAEHTEPWPMGRTNHYLFDMNRDWFAMTQPETRGRVKALQEWYPLVFVDLHEMGADSTYYFAPECLPYNPHIATDQRASLDWFGRNNARWFDEFGFSYFTREAFDAFYPGYGASWPLFYGAVAMTYEQASARGLVMRRRIDGKVFDFRDTVRHHFVASVSTCETAADNREKLLENFYNYRRSAVEEGNNSEVKEYVLPRTGDTSAVDKLANLLASQGVEVRKSAAAFNVEGKDCPAGSYAISLAQPAHRLIRTLLDPDVSMEKEFVEEQERLREKRLPDEIFDVVAWSLPLMYNVEMISSKSAVQGSFDALVPGETPAGKATGGKASVAYLVPWGSRASARLLASALRNDVKVWTADKKFELNGREFTRGTLIIKVPEHDESLHQLMPKLAVESGAEVVAANSGYVINGISLGSRKVVPLRKPEVALAWDYPTSSLAAGNTRFVIERQFGYPVTPIRTMYLGTSMVDLSRYDVLILPPVRGGGYSTVLGPKGIEKIKDWVKDGGTLIAVEGAVETVADPEVDLLSVSRENRPGDDEKKAEKKPEKREARVPGKLLTKEEDWEKAVTPEKESPDSVPGVLVKAKLDPDHWVTAGLGDTVNVMVRGSAIFTPLPLDKGVNAAYYAGPDELLLSGHLWEENRKQLAFKPFVLVQEQGRGMVVGFTADPNMRAFMDGLNILFINSIFRSQAPTRAIAGE